MHKIALGAMPIVVAFAVALGGATPASATVTQQRMVIKNHIDFNVCTREAVVFNGELRAVVVTQNDGSVVSNGTLQLRGVGLVSRTTYTLNRRVHHNGTRSTAVRRDVLVSHGRLPNLHVVIDLTTGAVDIACTSR